ncbi:MAG: isopentenyl-diphosphate Delta-isomerase [Bacteroidales bacterium]|nr:isopentenyl-diphosphate Delta-isomerase [Bacteroidales bacterium]
MQVEYVVIVNKNDMPLGTMEKMEAHEKGILHRAFSVFVFNSQNQLLLQKRASEKYHSPDLWTNTVCSHPRAGEDTLDAGHRRLGEEMGMDCELKELFSFVYKAPVGNGLKEHEFDHVLVGFSDTKPVPNPEEASDFKYVGLEWVKKDMEEHPDQYTVWFKIAFKELLKHQLDLLKMNQSH